MEEANFSRTSRRHAMILTSSRSSSNLSGQGNAQLFVDIDALRYEARMAEVEKKFTTATSTPPPFEEHNKAHKLVHGVRFQKMMLCVVCANALWIGVQVELDETLDLLGEKWYLQVVEYLFCVFFGTEWLLRFWAFQVKRTAFRNVWFTFDTFLLAYMLLEDFALPLVLDAIVGPADEGGSTREIGQLSVLRMLRLLRLIRLVRIMRGVPEIWVLLRSLRLALRSVLSVFSLLFVLIYVFAIILRTELVVPEEAEYLVPRFDSLPKIMMTLLFQGALKDRIAWLAEPLLEVDVGLTICFTLFSLLSHVVVLNMLVAMLCEVVNAVTQMEKEKSTTSYVLGKLLEVLEALDEDGNGTISREEFNHLLDVPEAVQALQEIGIDVPHLMSLRDHIFSLDHGLGSTSPTATMAGRKQRLQLGNPGKDFTLEDDDDAETIGATSGDEDDVSLSFVDFLDLIMKLRPNQRPSVASITELHRIFQLNQRRMTKQLDAFDLQNQRLTSQLKRVGAAAEAFTSRARMKALIAACEDGIRQEKAELRRTRSKGEPHPHIAAVKRAAGRSKDSTKQQAVDQALEQESTKHQSLEEEAHAPGRPTSMTNSSSPWTATPVLEGAATGIAFLVEV